MLAGGFLTRDWVRLKDFVVRRIVFPSPSLHRAWNRRKYGGPRGEPRERPLTAVLQSEHEWRSAADEVQRLGLRPYETMPAKSWDSLVALRAVLSSITPREGVLDAGGEEYSTILPWLSLYGFRDLLAVNTAFERSKRLYGVHYLPGDITETSFPQDRFGAAVCLSVIEHGVDLERFLREMERVIRPRGLLVVSTDYFESRLDTAGKHAFGAPVHVFNRPEIERLVQQARARSFELQGETDLSSPEAPIEWSGQGLRYTFVVLTFRRRA
jgi:SAM-dependent methyltransferase